MRAMKDSGIEWIGQIPQDWSLERMKFHASFNPVTDLADLDDENDVSFIPMDHLKQGVHFQNIVPYRKVKKGYVCFVNGDVLMAKVTPCLENGNLAIAENLKDGIGFGSTEINVIRCKTMMNRFLFYLLQCSAYIDKARYNMYGVAGLKRLDPEFIPNSFFPIPSKEEQAKIVDYLDSKCTEIDALIAAKEKSNALLKEQRQSIIYEAVTKGLNPTVPMKDSGVEWIGQIPQEWNVIRLRSQFSFRKGLPITKADLTETGIGVISYGQIHSKTNNGTTINYELIRYIDAKYLNTNESSLVGNGDFIFADTSEDILGCGNCVYVDVDYPLFAGYHTMILKPKNEIISKYYAYLFTTDAWRSQIRAKASGVKLFSITQKMLRDTLLIEPSEEEMDCIIKYLDGRCAEFDALIAANEKTIQKLKEYRQSIIYEAVTGKIEV